MESHEEGVRTHPGEGKKEESRGQTNQERVNERIRNFNVFLVGLCFAFIFTGFYTMSQTQALIYNSAAREIPGFKVNGLISNGIVYGVFAFASWFAPVIVLKIGIKPAMMLSALTYTLYMSQLLYLNNYTIYIASALLGLGGPVIWTAQGTFLANNSRPSTITRNSAIFWAMSMSSLLIGNLQCFFMFQGEEYITSHTRNILGVILIIVSGLGTFFMFGLRPTPSQEDDSPDDLSKSMSVVDTLSASLSLATTKDMLWFSFTLFYTGLHLCLWDGLYSTCIGFTGGFGPDRKSLATISGIIVAAGEVTGGILFGFLAPLTIKRGRYPIVILGFILSMTAYSLIFINIPASATMDEVADNLTSISGISPNRHIALSTSFMLGFSDACFITQVTSVLGGVWKLQAPAAFGIFKFLQSLASCLGFFYSTVLELHWQLLIVALFDIAATVAFVKVEIAHNRKKTIGSVEETTPLLAEHRE